MAAYTVTLNVEYDSESETGFAYFDDTNGYGGSSAVPLVVAVGDTVTFAVNFTSVGAVTFSGLAIFTDNSNISISSFSYSPVTRTVASGGNLADAITGSYSLGGSDTFYFSRIAATANVTITYNSSLLGGTYNRIRSGYWETTGGVRSHLCTWNVDTAGLVHKWYRGGTLLRTLTVSTSGNQQLAIADSAATNGTDVTYTLRVYDGTTEIGSASYNVIYCIAPDATVSANTADLTVPIGATTQNVRLLGVSTPRTAYRVTLASIDDGGTLGDDTVAAVANTLDAVTPWATTNNSVDLTTLPGTNSGDTETYRIWSYRYPLDGSNNEQYGENKYYDMDRTFTLTRAEPDVVTNFVPALSEYTEGVGTQTITFTFDIANPSQSSYWYRLSRASGTNEPDFPSTQGTVTVAASSFSISINNDSIDETGSQGETFYAQLWKDSSLPTPAVATASGFTLFDNDVAFAIGTISPSTTLAYDYGYPDPVTVQVTNNGQSGLQPNSRIYNVTKGVVAYAIADLPNPGNTETYTLNLSNDNALPDSGTTNTYRLDVWNGDTLLAGPTFTISRAGADTTPNPFDLGGPITNSDLSTNYFSNVITVAGLTAGVSTSISISGTGSPAYSKNGGGYTSSSGTVVNGDTVRLRVTSSASQNTTTTGTLNIGGVTDSFSVTTVGAGSGGGTIPSTDADYGIEVYNLNGTKTVLSPATRYGSVVAEATFTLQPKDQANDDYLVSVVDMSELTTSNSGILILTSTSTIVFTVAREAGGFRISNNDPNNSYLITAVAVRY